MIAARTLLLTLGLALSPIVIYVLSVAFVIWVSFSEGCSAVSLQIGVEITGLILLPRPIATGPSLSRQESKMVKG